MLVSIQLQASCLIKESISPIEAFLISAALGRSPLNTKLALFLGDIFLNLLISSNPTKPIDLPRLAWCSSSASTASCIIISLGLISFLLILSDNKPSIITEVSGTILSISLLFVLLISSISIIILNFPFLYKFMVFD